MKLCINCKFHETSSSQIALFHLCKCPNIAQPVCPVTGHQEKMDCFFARKEINFCGPDGRFFEEKTKYAPKDGDCSGDLRKASPEEMFELGKEAGEALLASIKNKP